MNYLKNTFNSEARVKFVKAAVVPTDENCVEFTQLNSSRCGGVGVEGGNTITVPAKNINDILKDTINAFGSIDILKIDIESLETEILNTIKTEYLAHIDRIYVELPYGTSIVLDGFHSTLQGQGHKFKNQKKCVYLFY